MSKQSNFFSGAFGFLLGIISLIGFMLLMCCCCWFSIVVIANDENRTYANNTNNNDYLNYSDGTDYTNTIDNNDDFATPAADNTTANLGEVVELTNYTLEVSKFQDNYQPLASYPIVDKGYKYVAVYAKLTNQSERGDFASKFDFKLLDCTNNCTALPLGTGYATDEFASSKYLSYGQSAEGWILFEVEQNAKVLKFQYTSLDQVNQKVTVDLE